jgi:hypothetical protein
MAMNVYQRGGIPALVPGLAAATPQVVHWRGAVKAADGTDVYMPANFLRLQNEDPILDLHIAFTEADAVAGIGMLVPSRTTAPAFGGIVEFPVEIDQFWIWSDSGTPAFTAMVLMRRG